MVNLYITENLVNITIFLRIHNGSCLSQEENAAAWWEIEHWNCACGRWQLLFIHCSPFFLWCCFNKQTACQESVTAQCFSGSKVCSLLFDQWHRSRIPSRAICFPFPFPDRNAHLEAKSRAMACASKAWRGEQQGHWLLEGTIFAVWGSWRRPSVMEVRPTSHDPGQRGLREL